MDEAVYEDTKDISNIIGNDMYHFHGYDYQNYISRCQKSNVRWKLEPLWRDHQYLYKNDLGRKKVSRKATIYIFKQERRYK